MIDYKTRFKTTQKHYILWLVIIIFMIIFLNILTKTLLKPIRSLYFTSIKFNMCAWIMLMNFIDKLSRKTISTIGAKQILKYLKQNKYNFIKASFARFIPLKIFNEHLYFFEMNTNRDALESL